MALLVNIETNAGVTANNAYARIDAVSGSKDMVHMTINFYLSQNHFLQGKSFIQQVSHSFVPSVDEGSENFIKQGYEHAKTIPEFAGAIDA